jgi:flagellin-specific chaperone FliS
MEKTIHETKKAIELHDVSKKGVLCDRALSILSVLQVALQEEIYPELFTPLSQLYVFFGDCFLESSQNLNGKLLDDILPVWQTLHQAWRQAVDIDQKTD